MNGLDGLLYMSSTSDSTGSAHDHADLRAPAPTPTSPRCRCRTSCSSPMPLLPQEVQRRASASRKSSSDFLMIVGFVSEDGSMIAQRHRRLRRRATLQDPLSRVRGVGDVQVFGSQYAMRIWLDPDKLDSYQPDAGRRHRARSRRRTRRSRPASSAARRRSPGQQLNATITAQTRLQTPEQFARHPPAQSTRTARACGSRRRARRARRARTTTSTLATTASRPPASAIRLATGANALDDGRRGARRSSTSSTPFFPPGLKVVVPVRHHAVRAASRSRRW